MRPLANCAFFPNLYLVNHKRKFQAVCISKNAWPSLKRLVLLDDYPEQAEAVTTFNSLHDFFRCRDNERSLVAVGSTRDETTVRRTSSSSRSADGREGCLSYLRFAVFRDPVERAVSLYRNKFHAPTVERTTSHNSA